MLITDAHNVNTPVRIPLQRKNAETTVRDLGVHLPTHNSGVAGKQVKCVFLINYYTRQISRERRRMKWIGRTKYDTVGCQEANE